MAEKNNNTKAILIAAFAAAAIYMTGIFVMLSPLPLIVVYVLKGRKDGVVASALSVLLVAATYLLASTGIVTPVGESLPLPGYAFEGFLGSDHVSSFGVGYFFFFVAIAVAISEGMKRKYSLYRIGILSIASSIGALILLLFYMGATVDGLIVSFKNYFVQILTDLASLNQNGAAAEYAGLIKDNADSIAVFTIHIIPSIVFVYALLVTTINYLAGKGIARRRGKKLRMQDSSCFRLPDMLIWGVIVSGSLFFVDRYVTSIGGLEYLVVNSLIAFLALYFLQGMAVVSHMLRRVRIPIMRTLAYVLIILFFRTISIAIIALGLADVWVNFRVKKLKTRQNQST